MPKRAVLLAISAAAAILLASNAFGASVAIINGSLSSPELSTTELITNNLVLLETLQGNTVTVYNAPPSSLAGFSSVWDISWFDSAALTPAVDTEYTNYLAGGGDLVLIGENTITSPARDASIVSLINQLGGGSVGLYDDCDNNGDTQTVNAPFTGPNPVSSITYNCSAGFVGFNQKFITQLNPAIGTGLVFAPGTLSAAPEGALLTLLDSNFMQGNVGVSSQNLLENLIGYVDSLHPQPSNPGGPSVPEPTSLVLIATGLLGLAIGRTLRR